VNAKNGDADPYHWNMATHRNGDCPADEEVAAYLDGRLAAGASEQLRRHAADCDDCRALLAGASDSLGSYQRPPRRPYRVAALGGAAALSAAALLLMLVRPPLPPHGEDGMRNPAVLQEDVQRFAGIEPADGAAVAAGDLVFAWDALPEGTVYRLTLSDERGTMLWSERTDATSLRLPASAAPLLNPGAAYYWRVEALLPDLSTAVTTVRRFETL
jgi:hypothetical protein